MKYFISNIALILIVIIVTSNINAQSKSDKLYENYAFASAVEKYEKELAKDSGDFEVRHRLAIAYTKMNRCEEALEHYIDIITLGNSKMLQPTDWNNIGQLYLGVNKDRNAELAFKFLKEINPKSLQRQRPVGQLFYSTRSLDGINTEYSEFCPTIYGENIVFASDRPANMFESTQSKWTGTPYLSLFQIGAKAAVSEAEKTKVTLFSARINDLYHVGPACYLNGGNTLYFTKITPDHKGVNRAKIYRGDKEKGKWKDIEEITLNDDAYSVAHPAYIEEKNMLVFSSDMPGGFGGMDLYYSIWENNGWSKPQNFGEKVNTIFNEVFPSTHQTKSNVIYYSSNGRFGYGGLDVYKLTLNDFEAQSVNILPPKINSNKDDFGVCFTTDTSGFVSSSRDETKGMDDIFSFSLDYINIHGCLVDKETGNPVKGHKLYLVNEKEIVIDSMRTSEDGCFEFRKLPYDNVGIIPEDSENAELLIRMKDKSEKKDPFASLYLMSSKKQVLDTTALTDDGVLTLFMESKVSNDKVKCVIYENGEKAVKVVFAVRDSTGALIDSLMTDSEGCIKIRKLYPEKSYFDLMEDDDGKLAVRYSETTGLTNNAEINSDEVIIIKRKTNLNDKLSLTGKLIDMLNPSKDLGNVRIIIIGQDGFVEYSSVTDSNSSFFFKKLPSEHSTMMMIDDEDGVLVGTERLAIEGKITPVENYAEKDDEKRVYLADTDNEKYDFSKVNGKGEFRIEINKEKYQNASNVNEVSAFDDVTEKDTLISENIYFELAKATLTLDAEKILDKLVSQMRLNPSFKIKINAHTDSRGSSSSNLDLSERRAKSVQNYIVTKGINDKRISSQGFGETQLLNRCKDGVKCSEEEHLQNRRTEFQFIWE